MNTYVVYGTFECVVVADSASEAKLKFDIDDAEVSVQGCYTVDDEVEE